MRNILIVTLLLAGAFSAFGGDIERRLYVALPGIRNYMERGGAGIAVFDIDHEHRFIKRILIPGHSDQEKPENVKGVCASAKTQRLYFTTLKKLWCIDLKTEQKIWDKALPGGCDRLALTPDGKTLYVPSLEGAHWNVVDAMSGEITAVIQTNSGAHNTIAGADGKRVYLAGLKSPLLSIVDTTVNEVTAKCGPFSAPVRPFTVNGAQTVVYVCVNERLGFEIGDLKSGAVRDTIDVPGVEKGTVKRHGCPCHGIGLTPNETELWLCDGANQSLHIFDNRALPPKYVSSIKLFDDPGWVTFSLDGKFAYPSTLEVIDTATKKIVAELKDEQGRRVQSEKVVEVHVLGGDVVKTGDQFGIGRAGN